MSSISFLARRGMYLDTLDAPGEYAAPGKSEPPLAHADEAGASRSVDVPPLDGETRINSV